MRMLVEGDEFAIDHRLIRPSCKTSSDVFETLLRDQFCGESRG